MYSRTSARHLLSSSDCDGLALETVLNHAGPDEQRLWSTMKLGYTESQGLPQLREAIARQYATLTSEQVLVVSPGEANFCLMNVLLEPGDEVVCTNSMSEVLALIALKNKAHLIGFNREKIIRNLGVLSEFQSRHRGFIDFAKPAAGSTLFARLTLDEPALQYCDRLVAETGVMLVPSELFDFSDQHVRIGLGRERFSEGLAVWSAYLAR